MTDFSSERAELKAAIAAHSAAHKKLVEAKRAVDSATQSRWKVQDDLEKLNEEVKEPLGFDDLDGALTAIAGGAAGVLELNREDPRKAKIADLEKEVAAWTRAGDLAQQALTLREKDAASAARDVDEAARAVVAAESDWPALKRRYEKLCGELRALRARLGDLAEAVPNMSSPQVCGVDVRDALWLNPLVGPERDTTFGDWLNALRRDPDARMSK
jgi:hypothetical protein